MLAVRECDLFGRDLVASLAKIENPGGKTEASAADKRAHWSERALAQLIQNPLWLGHDGSCLGGPLVGHVAQDGFVVELIDDVQILHLILSVIG